jgi:F-type H+-transporting ATPase subunit a
MAFLENFQQHQEKEVQEHSAQQTEEKTDVGGMIFHHILNSDEIELTPVGKIHLPYMFFDKDGFHFFKSRTDLVATQVYKVDPHHLPIKASRIDGSPISFDMSISKHLVFMWLACILLFLVVRRAAKNNAKSLIPKGI